MSTSHEHPETNVVDTLKSLVVAFVLAMTFRAFVTEGFVIPTGSMAPTLFGKHVRLQSPSTGWEYPVGIDSEFLKRTDKSAQWGLHWYRALSDPMLGPEHPRSGMSQTAGFPSRLRSGDRILVHKSLFPFVAPKRWDVVVFKNPTNPNGGDGNYIKRLGGLPNESVWLANGDVFAGSADVPRDFDRYEVQRKPDHVQRAVWQPVYRSDFPLRSDKTLDTPWSGAPWKGGDDWVTEGTRAYRCTTAAPTTLEWDLHARQITDWQPYNMLGQRQIRLAQGAGGDFSYKPVGDIRVAASIVPDQDGVSTRLQLVCNHFVYEFVIEDGTAQLRMRSEDFADDDKLEGLGWIGTEPVSIDPLPAGEATTVEFWHVDQRLVMFIDGDKILEYTYDWNPVQRSQYSVDPGLGMDDLAELARRSPGRPPMINWSFSGSPLSLYSVELDRDLYYRFDRQYGPSTLKNPSRIESGNGRPVVGNGEPGFGTHPDNLAILGPDHFFMLGDNSPASSDSRLWGNPHPLVSVQIDAAPFVVPRSLLLGKAWVVYFPSPLPMSPGGPGVIPDFGHLRFIR